MDTKDDNLPDYDQMNGNFNQNQADSGGRNKYGHNSDGSADDSDEDSDPEDHSDVRFYGKLFSYYILLP